MNTGTIESIRIEKLFGYLDYTIPESGILTNPAILYGDNGAGKSTILNLIFHLLSSAGDRGHRTALFETSFLSISVTLKNGYTLNAEKIEEQNAQIIVFTIFDRTKLISEWRFNPVEKNNEIILKDDIKDFVIESLLNSNKLPDYVVKGLNVKRTTAHPDNVKRGRNSYLQTLSTCCPTIFFVSAERRLESDALSDAGEIETRELWNSRKNSRLVDLVKNARQIALKQAQTNAAQWVRNKAIKSATQGSMNVHSVYESILSQLAGNYSQKNNNIEYTDINNILAILDDIEQRSLSYSEYGLAVAMDFRKFRTALMETPEQSRAISAEIIFPYVKSVLGRLAAVDPVYKIIDEFINQVNKFLARKRITYSLADGFIIKDDHGTILAESMLSSGEQQLLLMFFYVLTSQDQPSVFIVDEPEISLNIKWQRQLLRSLSQITMGTDTQFIFASHSLELIAQHRSSVVVIG